MRKFVFTIVLGILSTLVVDGQKATSPLKLEIITSATNLCLEKTLPIQAKLTNISNKKVAVDSDSIWYMLSFTGNGNFGGRVHDVSEISTGKKLILNPKQSYKTSRSIKLEEYLFDSPGVYQITTTYGQFQENNLEGFQVWKGVVKSNEAKFLVKPCIKNN